jgi:hypothetical protein
MGRQLLSAALVAPVLALAVGGAQAQFGSIFGPPRPPANVPNGGPSSIPNGNPNPIYQEQQSSPANEPPAVPPRGGTSGAVQSQPLPPPPGVAVIDPGAPPNQPLASTPPGQRQPAQRGGPPAADSAPPTDDAIVTEPPSQKLANTSALFTGLDKITGRIINFDVAIGETVQFGALQVTPRACYTRPATEATNTDAFVEVDEVTLQGEVKRIFTGWMFASSPGLHAVEHPVYDVWLTDCKGAVQTVNATPPADTPAAPPTRTQPSTQRTPAQQRRPSQQVPPQSR